VGAVVGRVLRVTGTTLAIGLALVTPVLAGVAAAPASADTVVDGCTIVSNPTSTDFTNCPNANLAGAAFSGLNLSYANFAGATFDQCTIVSEIQPPTCVSSNFVDSNLSSANLSGATFVTCLVTQPEPQVGCGVSDLTGANLSGANLANVIFSPYDTIIPNGSVGVTLTGANVTGTILVPPNQSVAATSAAGSTVTWSTPAGLPGATPGTCTPASGSQFPLFTTTVTCQVLDTAGNVATGTFQVDVTPTTQYFDRTLIPSSGASLSGTQILDAEAGDGPGVSQVAFELTGGTLNDAVIATGTATIFGWLAEWSSTAVPNGTYTLQSVATDHSSNVSASTGITVTVDNPPPSTTVGLPANGATVKGSQWLDASASPGVTKVVYELTGGTLHQAVIGTATPTSVGWLASFTSTSVANGSYTLESVASYAGGVSGTSAPVTINVSN
jgi:uncharacterized protein YjbI with pentapeptide repeats